MRILVLEASTTSAKAMVHDTVTGTSEVVTAPYPSGPDPTTHDPDEVVAAVTSLGRQLSAGREIAAVALVGVLHGVFLADRELRPVSPVYLWTNTESAGLCRDLRQDEELTTSFYRRTGCMVNATYPVFTLPLLARRGLPVADSMVLDEGSYLNWVLTGRLVQTRCVASGSGMLNIHERSYDPGALAIAGINVSQLPELVDSEGSLALSDRGAALLGLRSGTPVLPTNSDGGANQVGVGALRPGVMTFSVGTSGALRLATDAPRLPDSPSTWCYLSPRSWLSGAATAGACSVVDWFRHRVAGGRPYAELEAGFQGDCPVFLPFLYGERCPGWDDQRQGGFIGLTPQHDLRAMYHAVQEGVLFNLYQCYRKLVELNGTPTRVKLSGGILHSEVWSQLCADIFGIPLEVDEVAHASLLGGAVLGMELLGAIPSAVDYDSPAGSVITPDPAAAEGHMRKYERYLEAYHGGTDAGPR
ncbi:MAG: FGGY-family carbohydrate kinase [Propionibacteriaceae bacterium]|nr:FGGY-family carbohydrate kinase [Propionibacteriaceae bacterium]